MGPFAFQMKAWSVLLCALIAVAPAAAVCACAEPSPPRAAQGCDGTDHCCCGDAASKSSRSEDCPRAEKSVDAAEIAENSMAPGLPVAALLPSSPSRFDIPGFLAAPRAASGASPPSHP